MAELARHGAYLAEALAASAAAPLSRRKAMLVALLIDAQVDRAFAAGGAGDDILVFRSALARDNVALGLILDLAWARDGVVLTTEAVAVPVADYGTLAVEDFMVSLYNDHSVHRLQLVDPQGQRHDMMAMLQTAVAALDRLI